MMPWGFEYPVSGVVTGAIGAVLLIGIYWLRHRSRRQLVPALFLWDAAERVNQSGRRFLPVFPPGIFYLELAALLLLALGAASPFFAAKDNFPPLAVILDNSFSMLATSPDSSSPRELGEQEVRQLVSRYSGRRILWVLAGREPRLSSDSDARFDFASVWTANEDAADLNEALQLVRRRVPGAEIAVITDRPPEAAGVTVTGDVGYFALGTRLPNTAIVNARRSSDRVLVEVKNFSSRPRPATVRLLPGDGERMELAPGERRKIVLPIPASARENLLEIAVSSPDDAIEFDNRVELLAEDSRPVAVAFAPELGKNATAALERVLEDNPDYRLTTPTDAELLIAPPGTPAGKFHRLLWHGAENDRATVFTELMARSGDELLSGVNLRELNWAAASGVNLPGTVLIQTTTQPVLTRLRRLDNRLDYHLNLVPGLANPVRRAFWPVWFWNLAREIRRERPGPLSRNLHTGELATVRLADEAASPVKLFTPSGEKRDLTPTRNRIAFPMAEAGIYRLTAGECSYEIAATSADAGESDLSEAGRFRHEASRPGSNMLLKLFRPAWAAFLGALALLVLHLLLTGNRRGVRS